MSNAQDRQYEVVRYLRDSQKGNAAKLVALLYDRGYRGLVADERVTARLINKTGLRVATAMALLKRSRKSCDWLLSRGADINTAVETATAALNDTPDSSWHESGFGTDYGTFDLGTGRKYIRYPKSIITDIAALETRDGLLDFWKDVAVFDERPAVRNVALGRIEALGTKRDLVRARKKRTAVESETASFEKDLLARTREFKVRIRRLFRSLKDDYIFGADARNLGGWDPHDHWFETVDSIFEALSEKQRRYFEEQWEATLGKYKTRFCYVDTKWEIQQIREAEVRVGRHVVMTKACESTWCYFSGKDEEDSEAIATSIVMHAPTVGLKADWGGSTSSAVRLSMSDRDN